MYSIRSSRAIVSDATTEPYGTRKRDISHVTRLITCLNIDHFQILMTHLELSQVVFTGKTPNLNRRLRVKPP